MMDFVSIARRRREVAVASLDLRQLELPGMTAQQTWTEEDNSQAVSGLKVVPAHPQAL